MTYKALEDYFNNLEPVDEDNDMYDKYSSNAYEEPLTSVYFQISTPAVAHYPSNEHTIRLNWKDGATWHDIIWEIAKTLEAQYGYEIKSKIFFQVHELMIEAEDSHGDPDLAKQMFSKGSKEQEREEIAKWLETECEEQFLADRVRSRGV